MRIETYEKDGLTFMKSSDTQTAEQIVEELNLFGELDLPLFFYNGNEIYNKTRKSIC